MDALRTIMEIVKWVTDVVIAFVGGDDSPETKRLIEVLPDKYRSDIEHMRQAELLKKELEADLESDSIDDDG